MPADSDNTVILTASNRFQELGRLAIPQFTVGNRNWLGQGRWVFFSNNGSTLRVVYQAEAASGIPERLLGSDLCVGCAIELHRDVRHADDLSIE